MFKCNPHKIAISQSQKRYSLYVSPNDTLPVMAHFSYLESTLIPLGELMEPTKEKAKEMEKSKGRVMEPMKENTKGGDKSKERVPFCEDTDVNNDQALFGFECFFGKKVELGISC